MPNPTRPQIESTIALPTYQIDIDQGAGYVTISGAEVAQINTRLQVTSNIDNGFAFGTLATMQASVLVTDAIVISNWELAKLRIKYGFDTSDKVTVFEGVITKKQRQNRFYQFDCAGFDHLIERLKIYTEVFYYRPIATKTTALSIENPSDSNFRAGLLNYIMFSAGGRPFEQPSYSSDPLFKFWYSFDESIVKPRWSWISGENAWEEAYRLVRAAGGQLYQNVDGVIYYKQPLSFGYVASGATLYEFTSNTFVSIQEDASTAENVNTVKAAYIERVLQPLQQVYESTTPQLVPNSELTEVVLEMQYPVYAYGANINGIDLIETKEAVKAVYFDGRDATDDFTDFVGTITTDDAQRLTIEFTNTTGEPIIVSKLVIPGRPVTAGSEGIASYTNGTGKELQLEDNPYVQSFAQAYRYVRMIYDFYHTNRALITLNGVGYDPDRYLGEVVELTYSDWALSHARHRIIGLDYTNGDTMQVILAPISGLVTRDDVFIVNGTYSDGTTKQVSY